MARIGRRRRVLNEEVLAARSSTRDDIVHVPGDTPRYGAGANIENHPQVTDLVPRRYRVVALGAILAIGIGALAEVAAHNAEHWSGLISVVSADEITNALADRTVAWTSTTLLLLVAGYTRLIFSLRRHRVDDIRGRYRVWRTASRLAVALGFFTITGAHTLAGRVLSHVTGWELLPSNPGWWLAPAILLGGWLIMRLVFDVAECRVALIAYVLALGCFVLAAACTAGYSPAWAVAWPDAPNRLLPLSGNTFLLVGSLLFARYVVLDVQGLIEHATISESPRYAGDSEVEQRSATASTVDVEPPVETISVSSNDGWVDGSEAEARHLSKAERKRLRKQKNRKRAA